MENSEKVVEEISQEKIIAWLRKTPLEIINRVLIEGFKKREEPAYEIIAMLTDVEHMIC